VLAGNTASIEKGFPHMTLADERLKELDSASLTADERALLRCRLAAEFIHTGQHEAARESLSELWRGIGQRPNVELLEGKTAAEVLLQCGALSSRIGASRQVTDAQGAAKDLISESAALFESFGETAKAALAHSDLAMCYWRESAFDEARVLLEDAYSRADEHDELKATIALRFTVVEACAGRHTNAYACSQKQPRSCRRAAAITSKAAFIMSLRLPYGD
jgi:hypothetical protein